MKTPNIVIKGWTFDPQHEEWFKRIGPKTWLVAKGDLLNPPA